MIHYHRIIQAFKDLLPTKGSLIPKRAHWEISLTSASRFWKGHSTALYDSQKPDPCIIIPFDNQRAGCCHSYIPKFLPLCSIFLTTTDLQSSYRGQKQPSIWTDTKTPKSGCFLQNGFFFLIIYFQSLINEKSVL